MKILVYAHQMEVGGTQTNAIEISAALRDVYGYDVVIFATPGPMVKLIEQKNLRYIPAPEPHGHPSIARMKALRKTLRHERPDLIHVWDWYQGLDAYYGVYLTDRIPMVITDMTMSLNRLLPKYISTTFGFPELCDRARKSGYRSVEFIPPPIDVNLNAPKAVNPKEFREYYGIKESETTIVIVSRLSHWLKGESLFRAIDVVRELGQELALRLIIVGEGILLNELEKLAKIVNSKLKRNAIIITGVLFDPRPAYAAADIVIGMGSSALRGMAFAKPVVIVGERGFSATFNPNTETYFYYKGIYGLGKDGKDNTQLVKEIRKLAKNPDYRLEIGKFSRQFVVQNFSLDNVCKRLDKFLKKAQADVPNSYSTAVDCIRTTAIYLKERRFLYR